MIKVISNTIDWSKKLYNLPFKILDLGLLSLKQEVIRNCFIAKTVGLYEL